VAAHFNTGLLTLYEKQDRTSSYLLRKKEYFFVLNNAKNWASFDKDESREIVGCSKLSFFRSSSGCKFQSHEVKTKVSGKVSSINGEK
jgi:hypothetical protein